jgi:hypothetical protein
MVNVNTGMRGVKIMTHVHNRIALSLMHSDRALCAKRHHDHVLVVSNVTKVIAAMNIPQDGGFVLTKNDALFTSVLRTIHRVANKNVLM